MCAEGCEEGCLQVSFKNLENPGISQNCWLLVPVENSLTGLPLYAICSSLSILHPQFSTLNPTPSILHSASFNFQPYSRCRSLTLKKPILIYIFKRFKPKKNLSVYFIDQVCIKDLCQINLQDNILSHSNPPTVNNSTLVILVPPSLSQTMPQCEKQSLLEYLLNSPSTCLGSGSGLNTTDRRIKGKVVKEWNSSKLKCKGGQRSRTTELSQHFATP